MELTAQEYFKRIEEKVEILINENIALTGRIKNRDEEIHQLRGALEQEIEKTKNLENQIKINNIAKGNSRGGEDVKEMRAKINEVIRDVDRCIKYLKS